MLINSFLIFSSNLDGFLSCIIRAVSATNNLTSKLEALAMSFMKRENNVGPRVDLWGIPHFTSWLLDMTLFTKTY